MIIRLTHSYTSLTELSQAYMAFLNAGGLFVPCDHQLEMGAMVELMVTLPDETEPYPLVGPVVWLNPQADTLRPQGVGIAFSEEDLTYREHIEQLLVDKLGSGQLTWTL